MMVKVKGKVKSPLRLINQAPRHEDVCGSGGVTPQFLTSTLDGNEWSASRPLYPLDRRLGAIE
jgi:hypothetical protein